MALPTRSPEERARDLAKAAETRKARTALLNRVKSGEVSLADVIRQGQDDPIPGKIRALALVKALPKIGDAKAKKILADADVPETKRVQGLGRKQQQSLIEHAAA